VEAPRKTQQRERSRREEGDIVSEKRRRRRRKRRKDNPSPSKNNKSSKALTGEDIIERGWDRSTSRPPGGSTFSWTQ